MPEYTKNFNLVKPLPSEYYDVDVFNRNVETIDAAIQSVDAFNGEFSTPKPWMLFPALDDKKYLIDYITLAYAILDELTSKTYATEIGTTTLLNAINSLNTKTTNHETAIDGLNTETANQEMTINELNTKVTSHETAITTLNEKSANQEAAINRKAENVTVSLSSNTKCLQLKLTNYNGYVPFFISFADNLAYYCLHQWEIPSSWISLNPSTGIAGSIVNEIVVNAYKPSDEILRIRIWYKGTGGAACSFVPLISPSEASFEYWRDNLNGEEDYD